MYQRFPLFQSHIDLAHRYWQSLVNIGDCVVDATCGNGHDTLFLSKTALSPNSGHLYAIDIQKDAIASSKKMLKDQLKSTFFEKISFIEGCHSQFPEEIKPQSVKLFTYNLGYLPGGDKSKTTQCNTTLKSLSEAQIRLQKGGAISITCYPGHREGKVEEEMLLDFSQTLDPKEWSCCHHRWSNRSKGPSLLLIQRQVN